VEVLAKAADAAQMFWQALDARERALVGYALVWLAGVLLAAAIKQSRERLKAELRVELEEAQRGERRPG
jgi:hypothetical protein